MVGSCSEDIGPGLMPTAISWLFRGISEQKNKTGARFSVRVSAVEIAGPAEVLRDLLAPHATGKFKSFAWLLCPFMPNYAFPFLKSEHVAIRKETKFTLKFHYRKNKIKTAVLIDQTCRVNTKTLKSLKKKS